MEEREVIININSLLPKVDSTIQIPVIELKNKEIEDGGNKFKS